MPWCRPSTTGQGRWMATEQTTTTKSKVKSKYRTEGGKLTAIMKNVRHKPKGHKQRSPITATYQPEYASTNSLRCNYDGNNCATCISLHTTCLVYSQMTVTTRSKQRPEDGSSQPEGITHTWEPSNIGGCIQKFPD
jgi:hypothetical protein